jgi:hypothetical protein
MGDKRVFCLIMFLLLVNLSSASLGISPSRIRINFEPNVEKEFIFNIETDNPEQELEAYAKGDLSEYVFFDREKIVGSDSLIVILKFPNNIFKPGDHEILIGVKEVVDTEVVSAIGSVVAVQAPINIFVPYPGKYLEMVFKTHNVNVGEPINFYLKLMNQGKEDLSFTPIIDIFSGDEKKQTISFDSRNLKSKESIELKKEFDTINYSSGKYKAIATIDYGEVVKSEKEFRIGTLIVELIDYTREIPVGGINRFAVEIESGWNNKINGAHAEVVFLDTTGEFFKFKTSPVDLLPWSRKTVEGFFDTSNFTIGKYKANITLTYYGEDSGKTLSEMVEVEFVEGSNKLPWEIILIVVGIVLAVLLFLFFIKKYLLKNAKRK